MTETSPNAAALTAALIAGDAATIQPPAEAPKAGDNIAAMRSKVMAQFEVLGRQHARGEISLTAAAMLFTGAVREKLLHRDDAESVYKTFATGHNYVAHENRKPTDPRFTAALEVSKASVSTFRSFGNAAPAAQGDGWFKRVFAAWQTIDKDDRAQKSAYNAYVKCNREAEKALDAAKLVDPAKLVVTDDQLLDWMVAPEKKAKDAAQKLADVVAALGKLVKSGNYSGLLEKHYDTLVAYHADFKAGNQSPLAGLVTLERRDTGSPASVTLQ